MAGARRNYLADCGVELRLNLGAGKVILPMRESDKPHPLVTLPDTSERGDWFNVDMLPLRGIQATCDLFAYPFQWRDDSIDEIWLSHVAEHIPHTPRYAEIDGSGIDARGDYEHYESWHYARWRELRDLDGFYCFFAECWRILKHDARLTVICPYGKSDGALQDPQHTRSIVAQTFHYLQGGAIVSPTYDYRLPFQFKCKSNPIFRLTPPYQNLEPEDQHIAINAMWNVADEIRVELFAVKHGD